MKRVSPSPSEIPQDRSLFGSFTREQVLRRHEMLAPPSKLQDSFFGDAKLYPNRISAIKGLPIAPKSILEIGTLAGDFAEYLIDIWQPEELCLIDFFNSDDHIFHSPRFDSNSHFDYVKNRFSVLNNLTLLKGESHLELQLLLDQKRKFDFIYIDAGHTYADVSRDLKLASKLLNSGGIIGMNDYIMTDYYYDTVYGVVQATNEFLNNSSNYTIIGYALNDNLFSDIYLKKD